MTTSVDILIVDDNPTNLRLLAQMLTQAGYHARPTTNGTMALSAAQVVAPDLILLDIMMPDISGYEVCEQLKANPQTCDIPVIFISALETAMDKVRAFSVGGVDYIEKPFNMVEVLARIKNQLRLRSANQQLQQQNAALAYFSASLKQLNRLNTTTYQDLPQLCQDYLQTGCEMLGFAMGAIATQDDPPCILAVASTLTGDAEIIEPSLALLHNAIAQSRTVAIAENPESQVFQAYLSTPIWVNHKAYGTLNFLDPAVRSQGFVARESEIIELMAQSLGKYIETQQREKLRQQAEEETQLLLSVTQAISEAPDFTTALQVTLQQVALSSGWHYGEAWIPGIDGQTLQYAPAWYVSEALAATPKAILQELRQMSSQLHFTPGQGLPGRAWQCQHSEYLDTDALLSTEVGFARRDWVDRLEIQNVLSVPITAAATEDGQQWQQGDRVLAVLVFFLLKSPQPQRSQHNRRLTTLVTAVATQLGTAIQQKQDRDVLQALFAAMDDWVTVWDRHGRCLKVAPTHSALSPRRNVSPINANSLVGQPLEAIFPPTTAARIRDRLSATLARQQPTQLEYSLPLHDRTCWFDARLSPLNEEAVLLTARDISDRKLIEQKLRTNEAELRGVFEAMSDIVLAITPSEPSVRVMPTCFMQIHEYANVILDLTLERLFDGEQFPQFKAVLDRAITSQTIVHFEYSLTCHDRTYWFDASISPVTAQSAIWVARDISDRAALQASLEQLATELEQRVEQRTAQLLDANSILQTEVSDRVRAQRELARSTEQLQAVLDAVPGFVFWVGSATPDLPSSSLCYLGVNHRFARAFDLNPGDFSQQPLGFIHHDLPLTQPLEQFLQGASTAIAKTIALDLQGEPRSYLLVAQKYHHNNAAVAIGVDITPRIQAEQQRQQAYQRLELMTELTLKIRRSLDLNEILATIATEVKQLFDADRVALIQIETCSRYQIVQEQCNRQVTSLDLLHQRVPFPEPTAWESFNSGQYVTASATPGVSDRERRSRLELLEAYAELLVPIFIGDTLWGAIAIHSVTRPRQWQEDEIEIITALADQIGIALSQASLLNSLEERVAERTAQLQSANQKLQQEIRDRLLAELALRRSEMQLRLITDALPVLIAYVDGQEYYRFNNQTYSDWYDIPLAQITGSSVAAVLGDDYYQAVREYIGRALSGEKVSFEFYAPEINHQQRYLSATYIPDLGANNRVKGFFSVEVDITNRIAVEQMKDEFLSIASHELRTPLTSLRGSLGLLGTGRLGTLSEQGTRMLQIAINNTDRLVRLINDILDLQRIESGRLKTVKRPTAAVDLLCQARDAMQSLAKQAQVQLVLQVNGEPLQPHTPPLMIEVDPDRILQTLTNLISNAIKFSEPDTQVDLAVTLETDAVLFSVRDRGRGIPADKTEMIFERFQQVDASDSRAKGGTGLGLAICRQIIKQHNGEIWVDSEVDRGSTFYIRLPL
ncbi:MAG: PAS domain-containing protein [Jaaginema sp. PMC 1079.18]|nr:PAS domain-containing protein [Jaaginema sp. PMC 1080.18]MEC4851884.1 PAS domain-containing protein [Jaaginema sp. PMC 1079.18]MEC4865362.1 PAS domain-containing protein [Jaaginema sp. PMC 1078.18]